MTAALDIPALEALLRAAFGGAPGCREVRLSAQEADWLHTEYPAARLSAPDGAEEDGKAWYTLFFPA